MKPEAHERLTTIRVVAGALFDSQGRVLIAQRPAGKHMAGRWEFPGGKIDTDESELDALRRELLEELGVRLDAAQRLLELSHDYPERRVQLSMWRVTAYRGEPRTLEEVGEYFNLTRERIRQIEARAMSKLRHPSADTGARDLLAV